MKEKPHKLYLDNGYEGRIEIEPCPHPGMTVIQVDRAAVEVTRAYVAMSPEEMDELAEAFEASRA